MDAATAHASTESPRRPRVVDIATLLALLAALLNTTIGVLLAVTAASSSLHVQPTLVAIVVAISALYAAAVAVFALLFRSGKPWARTALMSVSALALLTLFAPNALNLGVIVLLLATCVLVYRRPVGTWVRTLQGRTPA